MGKIINKLNLNRTPQSVENNSLVFAKNIKYNKDGSLSPDTRLEYLFDKYNIFAHIVGVNSKIYLFGQTDVYRPVTVTKPMPFINELDRYDIINIYVYNQRDHTEYYETNIDFDEITDNKKTNFINFATTFLTYVCKLKAEFLSDDSLRVINDMEDPYTIEFRHTVSAGTFVRLATMELAESRKLDTKQYSIIEYDELTKAEKPLETGWKYQGGEITGCVTINNTSEPILTICEKSSDNNLEIPIKHINLKKCKATDDESIYTQAPNIPITNLHLTGTYNKQIPNGTYQFYIRYKIRDGFYTNWFPASGKCFTGSKETYNTIQGTLTGVDIKRDSRKSFIFNVEHLFDVNISNFEEFQIGFTITHDDATNARAWKSFNFSVNSIYFDYENVTEINIDDLVANAYELFNVGNVCYFKNKLYIADYKETDFNQDFASYAKQVKVDLKLQTFKDDGAIYIESEKLDKINPSDPVYTKWGENTIYDLFTSSVPSSTKSFAQAKKDDTANKEYGALTIESVVNTSINPDLLWIYKSSTSVEGHSFPTFAHTKYDNWRMLNYITHSPHYAASGAGFFIDTMTHPFSTLPNSKKHWYWASGSKKHNVPNRNGMDGYFWIYNNGFGQELDSCNDKLQETVLSDLKLLVGNRKLQAVTTNYNGNTYILWGESDDAIDHVKDSFYYGGRDLIGTNDDEIYEEVVELIKDKIAGVDNNGTFYAKINNEYIPLSQFEINYCTVDFETSIERDKQESYYLATMRYDGTKINHSIAVTINIPTDRIKSSTNEYEFTTLSPFTDYEFYIHYVKSNGVATNGYFICKTGMHSIDPTNNIFVIYPRISNVQVPEGYASYFISLVHVGDKILQGFNHQIIGDYHYIDCMESDAMIDSLDDNINIIDSSGQSVTAEYTKYHSSASTDPMTMLGNAGCIRWKVDDNKNKLYRGEDGIYTIAGVSTQGNLSYLVIYIATDKTEEYFYVAVGDKMIQDDFDKTFIEVKDKYPTINLDITINPTTETQGTVSYKIGTTNCKQIGFAYGRDTMDTLKDRAKASASTFVEIPEEEIESANNYWIKIINKQYNHTDKRLTKITPFIPGYKVGYYNRKKMYLTSYVCKLYKLDRTTCNTYYYAGTDLYVKDTANPDMFKVDDYDAYINTLKTNPFYVISHYNLNYLTIAEELIPTLRNYKSLDESIKIKQMIYAVQSATCSAIYELKSMYKDWVNKEYIPAKLNVNTSIFKNTVRSSSINADDAYKSIYTFGSEDYYNVPTNRGIVISMFSILDSIYIHTEHSLFKFSGKNSLSSEDNEVTLKEGDVFNTGISEIFDSKYGYAGLADKRHSIVTFNSYIFYDKLANTIYGYTGNNNLVAISDPIKKIIESLIITDIFFVADEFNDRFYMNIITEQDENICLSYNTKANGFISIHDFDFRDGFNSRLYTYFIESNEDKSTMYRIDKDGFNDYKTLFKPSKLFISDMSETEVENCIDIICNENYEKIKELNFINWICSAVNTYGFNSLLPAETINSQYAGSKLRIYTDQTYSDLIDLVDEYGRPLRSNDNRRMDATTALYPTECSYKYPTFNKGIWNYNYFRDIKNVVDIFHYNAEQNSDNHSILYGKYFVVRFIFNNKNFKFENITFNYNTI